MAVLNLAGKAKEMPVKLSDVVNTCHRYITKYLCIVDSLSHPLFLSASPLSPRCLHPNEPELEVDDTYWHLKDSVARYELLLLRALRFDIYITTPHKVSCTVISLKSIQGALLAKYGAPINKIYIMVGCCHCHLTPPQYLLHYLLAMSRWVDQEAWTKSHLPAISLCLLQDSYHTPLPLSLSPHKLATAVLYLSVLSCRLNIPGMYSYSGNDPTLINTVCCAIYYSTVCLCR